MAIALADLLEEKNVALQLRARKQANALREIVQLLTANGKIDHPETFLDAVLAREQANPRLIFVIGVPQRLINDYLICVGTLARLVKDDVTRAALLHAKTPRQLLDALTPR